MAFCMEIESIHKVLLPELMIWFNGRPYGTRTRTHTRTRKTPYSPSSGMTLLFESCSMGLDTFRQFNPCRSFIPSRPGPFGT